MAVAQVSSCAQLGLGLRGLRENVRQLFDQVCQQFLLLVGRREDLRLDHAFQRIDFDLDSLM